MRHTVWMRSAPSGSRRSRPATRRLRSSRPRRCCSSAVSAGGRRPKVWRYTPFAMLAGSVLSLASVVALGPLGLVPARCCWAARRRWPRRNRRRVLAAASADADLIQAACALADGLHAAGLASVGAAGVDWHVDSVGAAAGRVRRRCGRDGPERGVRGRAGRDGGPDRGAALPGAALRRRPGHCCSTACCPLAWYRPDRVGVAPGAVGAGRPRRARPGVRGGLGARGSVAARRSTPATRRAPGVLAGCRGTDPWAVSSVLRRSWS